MKTLCRWLLLLLWVALPSSVDAHVLDEYLQATLVDIEPGGIRLQINLTPGVEIADQVLVLMDSNRDGTIAANEVAAYAEKLKRELAVRLDGSDVDLKLTASNVPALAELRTGRGVIQLEFTTTPASFAAGPHRLTFENRHFPSIGEYLFNAAYPKSEVIQITSQVRNENQSRGEIEFIYNPPANTTKLAGIVAGLAVLLFAIFAWVRRVKRNSPSTG